MKDEKQSPTYPRDASDLDIEQPHYTEQEARDLIGKTFASLVAFSGVPQGTRGKVVDADNGGLGHWDAIIEWDAERAEQRGKRLRDWFTHDEMTRWMREVSE